MLASAPFIERNSFRFRNAWNGTHSACSRLELSERNEFLFTIHFVLNLFGTLCLPEPPVPFLPELEKCLHLFRLV